MRLIDVDKLCENLMTAWDTADATKRKDISEIIAKVVCPIVIGTLTVDAEPVTHARWEKVPLSYATSVCSNCYGYRISTKDRYNFYYCPHCGAKMDLK